MNIKPIQNVNFKGVYLVMGSDKEQKAFKKECSKYSKNISYVPVKKKKRLKWIRDDITRGITISHAKCGEKAALLLTGDDNKVYRFQVRENLESPDAPSFMSMVQGFFTLPMPDMEKTVDELSKHNPEKFTDWIVINNKKETK